MSRSSRASKWCLPATLLASMAFTVSACSSTPAQSPTTPPVSPPTSNTRSTAPSTTADSGAPTPVDSTTTPSPPGRSEDDSSSTTTSVLTPGKPLALSDFFNPSYGWSENRLDVADRGQIKGISAEISSCGAGSTTDGLELRLANKFTKIKFLIGQENKSDASDQKLTVEVKANNQQVALESVPFNVVKSFDVPVVGVNAFQIKFSLDPKVTNCGSTGSVTAVVFDAAIVS